MPTQSTLLKAIAALIFLAFLSLKPQLLANVLVLAGSFTIAAGIIGKCNKHIGIGAAMFLYGVYLVTPPSILSKLSQGLLLS